MSKNYTGIVQFKIDGLGCVYTAYLSKGQNTYDFKGNIGYLKNGNVHEIQSIYLNEDDDIKYFVQKYIKGSKYLEPTTKIIDSKSLCNSTKIDLNYKETDRVLIKGKIILNDTPVSNSLVEVFEIRNDNKDISLGYVNTDTNGMYFINLPINKNYLYKIVATYMDPVN